MPTKKGKKNFKDYTGIKFSDLLMPAIMGGVGSFSPAAGRGVGLGLQAFRTFQAGQEFGDEREAKKKAAEFHQSEVARLLGDKKELPESPDETRHFGFEGTKGPNLPTTDEQDEELDKAQVQGGMIPGASDPAAQKFSEVAGLGGPFEGGDNALVEQTIGGGFQDTAERGQIVREELHRREQITKENQLIDDRIRFQRQLEVLSGSSPTAAGYMGAQVGAGGIAHQRDMIRYNELDFLSARSGKERSRATAEQNAIKHGYRMEEIEASQGGRYVGFTFKGMPATLKKSNGRFYDADNKLITTERLRNELSPTEIMKSLKNTQQMWESLALGKVNGAEVDDEDIEKAMKLYRRYYGMASGAIDSAEFETMNRAAVEQGGPKALVKTPAQVQAEIEAAAAAAGKVDTAGGDEVNQEILAEEFLEGFKLPGIPEQER